MTSIPRYTSKAEGFRTAEEIEAMRPMAEPRPRAPRKAPNPGLRQVTSGIVCFCGERFGEHQALEFMLHLRAEVGEDLAALERRRARDRERRRENRTDPVRRELEAAYMREWRARKLADPEYREYRREQKNTARRKLRADPEYRERENAADRERRARKKAEREAAQPPSQARG